MKYIRIISKLTFTILLIVNSINYSNPEQIEVFLEGIKITDIKNDGVDIWVTTEGNGIYRYAKWKNKWINYSKNNNKIKQNYFYCIEVGHRYIWAGSADGLYIYDKKRRRWNKKRFTRGGQFGNWIRALKFDKNENKLWIGRFKYLTQFDLITKKYKDFDLTIRKNEKTNSVKSISLDGDSLIWIGVESGLHKFSKTKSNSYTKHYYSKNNYFPNEGEQISITNILCEQNNIWFGTDEFITNQNPDFNKGGLFRFDRNISWKKFSEHSKLSGSGIFSLELTGNYIWVSVYKFDSENKKAIGKGLNLINRKTLKSIEIKNSLIPDTIFSIHFDGDNIWLGTINGLRKINLRSDFLPNFSYQRQ